MKSQLTSTYSGHLGTIFSNMAIAGVVASFAMLAIPLTWAALGVALIFVITVVSLVTLGTVFLSETARKLMVDSWNFLSFEKSFDLLSQVVNYLPIVAGVTGALIAVSIVCLLFDKGSVTSKKRLIGNYILIGLLAAILIVYFILRGVNK